MLYQDIGLAVPAILLPRKDVDLTRWAVIACDQYTSDPKYWKQVKAIVGSSPSTLNLMLPEIYLDDPKKEQMIADINLAMGKYLREGILRPLEPGLVLIERRMADRRLLRRGLMVALDLEKYDFSEGSQSLIRVTERTIVERLPPRVKIREKAQLELPHIMVLIDDPDKTVIEPLFGLQLPVVYDFELMLDGGHIIGRHIKERAVLDKIADSLRLLADKDRFSSKYGVQGKQPLLYAMGDGNHSLATAKEAWNKIKGSVQDQESIKDHPARYALVELVNLHDPGLHFEPIHRVVFNIDAAHILAAMEQHFKRLGCGFALEDSAPESAVADAKDRSAHRIGYASGSSRGIISIVKPASTLEVASLQKFLDTYLQQNSQTRIDYIHGTEAAIGLGKKEGNMMFLLPPMSKFSLFKAVILDGALPRKTFSLGEADEKRFYMECRKIIN